METFLTVVGVVLPAPSRETVSKLVVPGRVTMIDVTASVLTNGTLDPLIVVGSDVEATVTLPPAFWDCSVILKESLKLSPRIVRVPGSVKETDTLLRSLRFSRSSSFMIRRRLLVARCRELRPFGRRRESQVMVGTPEKYEMASLVNH
jgi:hypothetical protein